MRVSIRVRGLHLVSDALLAMAVTCMTCEVLEKIQMDWRTAEGQNRAAAWSLTRALSKRLRQKVEGKLAKDSIDLLITGCEAQLSKIGLRFMRNRAGLSLKW